MESDYRAAEEGLKYQPREQSVSDRQILANALERVAQNERDFIRKWQAEGIAAAKAKGVKFGRPPIPLPDNFYPVHKAWRAKKLTLKQAAAACGMPAGTFYSKAVKFENST